DKTAVIVLPQKTDLLAEKLIELIENEDKLKNISLAGYEKIKEFTWEKSSKIFEDILLNKI
ncbi:MAG: hypothetical protein WCW66_06960, partial [Patescibacteria group bacterium]